MPDLSTTVDFESIYATDLVYSPGCWRLCGDAHCCNFSRYKSRLRVLGGGHKQELPLLPGEYDFLRDRGRLAGFAATEHRVVEYPLGDARMRLEFLVGREATCACPHDSRTTVCRLYPLLPVYDVGGAVVGVDAEFGIFEAIESVDGLERACKLTALPFAELGKFLAIAAAVGRSPAAVFYATAYRLAKLHARDQLREAKAAQPAGAPRGALELFEGMYALRRALDQRVLRPRLEALAAQFRAYYGDRFRLP